MLSFRHKASNGATAPQYTLTPLGRHKVDRYFDGSYEYRILDVLNGERYLTPREIAKGMNTEESKVKEVLTQLMDEFKYVVLRREHISR